MQSGDGLIVRLRPRGHLTPAQLLAIAALAERHGNGLIDLTRRANIQMRGVEAESLPALWAALAELDLLDEAAEAEAVRNVLSSPLAGIDNSELLDPRPLVDVPGDGALAPIRALGIAGKVLLRRRRRRRACRSTRSAPTFVCSPCAATTVSAWRSGSMARKASSGSARRRPTWPAPRPSILQHAFVQLGLRAGTRMRDVSGPDKRQLQPAVARARSAWQRSRVPGQAAPARRH